MDLLNRAWEEVAELEKEEKVLLVRIAKEEDESLKMIIKLLHGQNEIKRMLMGISIILGSGKLKGKR